MPQIEAYYLMTLGEDILLVHESRQHPTESASKLPTEHYLRMGSEPRILRALNPRHRNVIHCGSV
jgi:hypothetical protein